ncbi:MAG: TonB-dependent receptor [Rickettsiales bacterium]
MLILRKFPQFFWLILQILFLNLILINNIFAKKNNTLKPVHTNIISSATLPQITVTASNENSDYKNFNSSSSLKINKPLNDTPQSISVVGRKQIQDQNIVNLEEASRYVPGFFVKQGEGNRDQVSIRGNDTTADFFLDGARDDAQYFRDFYNIEQIEFLKGPNALAFGRGGSGGLVNRVSKFANGDKIRKVSLSGGSFENHRFEGDISEKINDKFNFRINGVYENSKTFRDYGYMQKYGINPTATIILSQKTDLKVGYEYFYDNRFNDRGLPSKNGSPLTIRSNKFFGSPDQYGSKTEVNSAFATINHDFNKDFKIKNHTRLSNYDKYYKNSYPNSAVDNNYKFKLASYDNDQTRLNFTNQTDFISKFTTKNIKHELLIGTEISHQASKLERRNGLFNGSASSLEVSVFDDIISSSVSYQTNIKNKNNVRILAGYLQDNLILNKYFEANVGVRLDNFKIILNDNFNHQKFENSQNLISPKLALIFKPKSNISNYASFSTSYLPSAGDQFNELDAKSKTLKAEKLQNYEVGSKIDLTKKFNISGALFILDRTNTRANDPAGTGLFVLSGASRTKGLELSAQGEIYKNFNIIAGFSHLKAEITSDTSSAKKGKKLALTPQNKFSLWGKYDIDQKYGLALGFINQSSQFASVDNSVRIKGFNRIDGGIFYHINSKIRTQLNVENIFNKKYHLTAHNNNNIQPGSIRAFKANLTMEF